MPHFGWAELMLLGIAAIPGGVHGIIALSRVDRIERMLKEREVL